MADSPSRPPLLKRLAGSRRLRIGLVIVALTAGWVAWMLRPEPVDERFIGTWNIVSADRQAPYVVFEFRSDGWGYIHNPGDQTDSLYSTPIKWSVEDNLLDWRTDDPDLDVAGRLNRLVNRFLDRIVGSRSSFESSCEIERVSEDRIELHTVSPDGRTSPWELHRAQDDPRINRLQ